MGTALPTTQSILIDVSVDKIALCGQGANSRADIVLTKRKENENMPKTFDELLAALTPEQATIVKNHLAALETTKVDEITELNKTIGTLKAEVETLKKSTEPTKEDILKTASPEMVSYIKSLQETVGTLVADKEEALAKSRFEAVKALPVDEVTLKSILKSASPAVYEVLVKAATAVAEKVLNAGDGKETNGENFAKATDAAYEVLEKAARVLMTKNTSMTFEQAFTEACMADSVTYAKYSKGAK